MPSAPATAGCEGDKAILLRGRAIALAGLGRREEALAATIALFPSEPDNLYAHLAAGRVYHLLNEYDQAETHFRQGLAIDPTRIWGHLGLGLLCFDQGRFDEAKPFLDRTLELNPHARHARNALAAMGHAPPAAAPAPPVEDTTP